MFCPRCGAKQEIEGARFCCSCGEPLDVNRLSEEGQSEPAQAVADQGPQQPAQAAADQGPQQPAQAAADGEGPKSPPMPSAQEVSTPPATGSVPADGVKKGVEPKVLAIIGVAAVVVVAIVLVVVFVVKPGGGGSAPAPEPASSTQSAEPTTTNEPQNTQTTSSTQSLPSGNGVDHNKQKGTARFVDVWRLESGTFDGYDAKTIYENSQKGKYVLLTLKEDGTGTLDKMGDKVSVKWKMKDDQVGLYEGDGRSLEMRVVDDGGLVLNNKENDYMVFRACPADGNAGNNAPAGGSSTSNSGKTQKVGSKKVGFVQVPESWKDNTKAMDARTVEDYGLVLYIDPDSSYQSKAQGGTSYGKAIQLTVQPTSYTEIAKGILQSYKSDGKFGETTQENIEIAGRKAILLVTTLKDDKLQLATIVLDRDGDGKTGVAMALNCGFDEASSKAVLQVASTWTRE